MLIKLSLELATVRLAYLIICSNYITFQLHLTQGKLTKMPKGGSVCRLGCICVLHTFTYSHQPHTYLYGAQTISHHIFELQTGQKHFIQTAITQSF